jgi:RWD domain
MVPDGWSSQRPIHKVKLEPDENELETELCFELLFQRTERYPAEEPFLKVSNPRGLSNADTDALARALRAAAAENVGMASIFAVMQAGKDWLDSKAGLQEGVSMLVLRVLHASAAVHDKR